MMVQCHGMSGVLMSDTVCHGLCLYVTDCGSDLLCRYVCHVLWRNGSWIVVVCVMNWVDVCRALW